MAFDCALRAPHGGIWVIGLIDNPLGFLVAVAVGSVVTAALVATLKTTWKSKASVEELEGAAEGQVFARA
jgi:PTS system fructose-specific IIC component